MKTLLKSALIAGLVISGAQIAYAQAAAPAAAAPVAASNGGTMVPGLAVANVEAVIANSLAFKVAQQQRPVTYKAQIDAAQSRQNQISAQIQPLIDRFNRERQAPTANTPAAQASLQQQEQAIQQIQLSWRQEAQKMLEPVALSEAYVQEQITDKIDQAIQSAMTKKRITLVVSPQSVIAASNSYNLNQGILDELNALLPSAQLVPPAGWVPREVREQRAAQAAAQGAAAAAPGKPAAGGR